MFYQTQDNDDTGITHFHFRILFDRVSDHVEMYVNRVDFRKITYRLMSEYALERTKKVCAICLNHLFQIFPQARRPSSASQKLLKNCVNLCYGVYRIKTKQRIFQFLKIDEHSYPYLVFSCQ